MDILTEDLSVFRRDVLIALQHCWAVAVEYVEDEPSANDAKTRAELAETLERCHALLFGRPWMDSAPDRPARLSYRIAGLLPMELEKRQALLEIRSESERCGLVLRWIADFLPKLLELERARKRAGDNGHGLN